MNGLVFSRDTQDLIRRLGDHKVRYLIVGGTAVIYHGYARLTGDVDFLIEPTKANALRAYRALLEFWGGSIPFVNGPGDLLAKGAIIQFGTHPNRIDFMNSITGVTFKEAWAGRIRETIQTRDGEYPLPIIGLAALAKNKKALGRHKDLDDLLFIKPASVRSNKEPKPKS
jgi:hypothetical protein